MISGLFKTKVLLGDNDYFNPQLILDSLKKSHPNRNEILLCRDLAFIVFFAGNDYLAKVLKVDIVQLWDKYLTLAKDSQSYIVNESCNGIDINLTIDLFGKFDTFSTFGITNPHPKDLKETEIHFQTILWNLVTYKKGKCPNYYQKAFYSAPTVQKLISYLLHLKSNGETVLKYERKGSSALAPLTPGVYSSLVSSSDHITTLDRNEVFDLGINLNHPINL